MKSKFWVRSAPLSVLTILVLGACSSSSNRSLESQAIDGYIVKAAVLCDEESGGITAIAGRLTCPRNTQLVTVSGGWDVGFDETAVTSNIVFAGELSAPANLGYVTPLSTVAVLMASTEGGYQPDLWEEKVAALGKALGDSALDLNKDPSDTVNNMSLIRFNAQIHQVITAFSKSQADYGSAIAAFATVMTNNAAASKVVDLGSNVSVTFSEINEALPSDSGLRKEPDELASSALVVAATNQAIAAAEVAGDLDAAVLGAETPDTVVDVVVGAAVDRAPVTIDQSAQSVSLESSNGTLSVLSIDDFEDNTLSNGSYQTQVDSGLVEVGYDNDVLQFDQDLDDVQVTMGFELTSDSDSRGLSFYSDDIHLSATKDESDSLVISLPEGATLHAVGTDSLGTTTTVEVLLEATNTFSNANGRFSVNYSSIVDKLENLGFEDIFANAAGNYEMTLIIGGIQIKQLSASGAAVPATGYDISVGAQQRSGAGFKGYLSYLD